MPGDPVVLIRRKWSSEIETGNAEQVEREMRSSALLWLRMDAIEAVQRRKSSERKTETALEERETVEIEGSYGC